MPERGEIPELHVEGEDDLHAILHLLQRHQVDMDEGKRPLKIVDAKNDVRLLEKIGEAVRAATARPVGFVLDIDVEVEDRWTQVRNRLRETGVDVPEECPCEGMVERRPGYPYPVGAWLMPDCTRDGGRLEHLLETLIPTNDKIWPLARDSTAEARKIGAAFRPVDEIKAELHCWLAWQAEPGRPFGTAIRAKFFNHDSPEALAFLRWLHKLYEIPELSGL